MKKIVFVIVVFVFAFLFCFKAFAHGGNTDSNGGHYDHYNNEYHYHHGHPAHDHPNGECPYVISKENEEKKNSKTLTIIFLCATPLMAVFPMSILTSITDPFLFFLSDKISFFKKYYDEIQKFVYILFYLIGLILWFFLVLNIC